MRVIGLTGGIASGKSTVSAMLRELGAEIIDADQLAREIVEPGQPALEEIARRFPGVLTPDGRLDRPKLGAHIFAHPEERAALNAITHPRVRELFEKKTAALEARGIDRVVYDVPLLIESGLQHGMEAVILVVVPREVQLARLMARDGFTREQAEARLNAQMPLEQKVPHATYVVDNSGSLDQTREQVERAWKSLVGAG